MLKRAIFTTRAVWRLLARIAHHGGALHRWESLLVGGAAVHVTAVSTHLSEMLTNGFLAVVMGLILVNQLTDGGHA